VTEYLTAEDVDAFVNFSWNEKDVLRGRRIFERFSEIRRDFMFTVDSYVTMAKKIGAKAFLVHDINLYQHSPDSAHKDGNAIDGEADGLSLKRQVQLALLFPFTGIFFYPFKKTPFLHLDQKTRNRPEGIVTLGFLNSKGKMVTTNHDFELVFWMLNAMPIERRLSPIDDSD